MSSIVYVLLNCVFVNVCKVIIIKIIKPKPLQAISAQREKGDLQSALDQANRAPGSRGAPQRAVSDREVEELRQQVQMLTSQLDEVRLLGVLGGIAAVLMEHDN